jgi:O-glycosyl hydrolase
MQRRARNILRLAVAMVAAGAPCAVAAQAYAGEPSGVAAATAVVVNGGVSGRTFDGVGAISGGGGNSRLLIDYPEPQRSQILDYLFKPGYGAAVQLLKLEIGGDANSTDGAEPSHEHVRGDINCNVGYEFWLGREAVARNPDIKLAALPWAAPGWIGNGNFWSQDMINYDISWLNCAKGHGLNISYLGGWNERGHDSGWYKNLRTSLDAAGYRSVQIVGDDTSWGMADEFAGDPALKNAVAVLGNHYVCGYLSQAESCSTTQNARSSGKPLWASEFGSQDDNAGVVPYIRTITRGYLDAELTGFMNWPLIAAITPNLPYATVGLMDAGSPWSGSYRVGKNLWANAHVAQFTQPGWRFLNDSASGYLGGDRANGSYISLESPNNTDYSTIYETSGTTAPQTVDVRIAGGLSTGTVHVWSTDMGSSNPADHFVRQADITPSNGSYSLTLQPNRIYSVTTTNGQGKGTAASPATGALPLPYSDNYDSYPVRGMAKYFQTMQGAYEIRDCAAGRSGRCLQQVAPVRPINWQDDSDAFGLVGDTSWSNYTVSTDVNMQQPGTVTLLGRANTQLRPQYKQAAYQLRISNTGAWSIAKNTSAGVLSTLASGSRPGLGLNTWHTIKLGFSGNQITATLDGAVLGTANDSSFTAGQVGFGVVGYQTNQFDNLTVTPNAPGTFAGILKGLESGRCVEAPGASGPVTLRDCNGAVAQQWAETVSRQLMTSGNRCLDVTANGTSDGASVGVWNCTGAANQQWVVNADGSVVNVGSGKCLDAIAHGTGNGTLLAIWTCNGGANQNWARGATAGILKNQTSGKCLDVPAANEDNGVRPALWNCNNGPNQAWTSTESGDLTVLANNCLDVVGHGTGDGTPVAIWDCTGGANQKWTVGLDGSVVGVESGKCLTVVGNSTADNALMEIRTCAGLPGQKWSRT